MHALGDLTQRGVIVHWVRPARVDRQRHPTLAARAVGRADQSNRRDERLAWTTSTVKPLPGPQAEPVGADGRIGPDVQRGDLLEPVGADGRIGPDVQRGDLLEPLWLG